MPLPEGLGRPRRAQPHQGPARRDAVVPLVVPDGRLRQLRHDGQRRAEADVRGVPARLRARARSASSRCATSRSMRDLVVDIDDFMQKLRASSRGSSATTEKPLSRGRVPPDAGGAGRVQAVQHVHQLHAVLRGLPGLRARPEVHRPGGDRAGAALQPGLARPGRASERLRGALGARGRLGLHVRRRVHEGLSRSTSIRPAPSSATS